MNPLREKFALLSISGVADAAIFIMLVIQGDPVDYSPKERFYQLVGRSKGIFQPFLTCYYRRNLAP